MNCYIIAVRMKKGRKGSNSPKDIESVLVVNEPFQNCLDTAMKRWYSVEDLIFQIKESPIHYHYHPITKGSRKLNVVPVLSSDGVTWYLRTERSPETMDPLMKLQRV